MFSSHKDINVTRKLQNYDKNTVTKTVGWNIIESNLPHAWLISEGESVNINYICNGTADHFDINPCKILEWKSSQSLSYISPVNVSEPVILDPSLNPEDFIGTSTMDYGIVCAQNPVSGMVGIAPRCKIKPIVVGNSGANVTPDLFTKALVECIANPPDIIFTNLECGEYSPSIDQQILRLKDMGVPFVCNASLFSESEVSFPSFSDHTISACTYNEEGVLINYKPNNLSFPKEVSCHLNNSYVEYESSSIATPIITSVLALLIAKNKKLIKISGLSEYSSVDEMIEILNNFANDKKAFGAEGSHCYGILDVHDFLSNIAKTKENQTEQQQQQQQEEEKEEEVLIKDEEENEDKVFDPNIESSYKKPSLINKLFSKLFKK